MAEAATANVPAPAPSNQTVEGFSGLSIMRQIGLMVGLAASVAIGFAVVLWAQEPAYQTLSPNLSAADASEIAEVLRTHNIRYKVDPNNGSLLVPAEQIYDIRMKLAAADVRLDNVVGLEVLDRDQGLGTSQFIESARYRRGLEGELARTIGSMRGIRSARVHIAIPGRSVFVRDARKPSASVLLDLSGGMKMEPDRVLGIMNLVANSIPEMERHDVSVVDQSGQLLSPDEQSATELVMAAKQFDYTRKVEDVLNNRVRNVLAPIMGLEHFKAEVTADIDFTVTEQTAEQFNPDLPAVRSEAIVAQGGSAGSVASGVPGALTNQPPGGAIVPERFANVEGAGQGVGVANAESRGNNFREQVTKNYELDRTISHTRHDTGRVRRLSVAVVVNDRVDGAPAADGAVTRRSWTDEEVARLTALVKDAVGFDALRGDSVNVINSSFAPPPVIEELPPAPIWEQSWFWTVVKQALGALFVLMLVFMVLRPIMRSLAQAAPASAESAAGMSGMEGMEGADSGGHDAQVTLSGGEAVALPRPEAGYEAQLNAIKGLVAENPGRVAQVVKTMIHEDD